MDEDIKEKIKKAYSKITGSSECCCSSDSCCPGSGSARDISRAVGYSNKEMDSVPEGANVGLGCGNPTAIASLKKGDVVLDLGSGAGFDAFLACDKVGETGRVIGIDMTEEMIEKARSNAKKGKYENVEFRLGEIENIPSENNSVDVIISNCVINLSKDKKRVFREAHRVLKPGGKMFISDIVLLDPLPEVLKSSLEAYVGCVAGASMKEDYLDYIKTAGFQNIKIVGQTGFDIKSMVNNIIAKAERDRADIKKNDLKKIENSVVSIKLEAEKGGKMKIKILGTGCPKCKKLEKNAREAINELGANAEIIKVTDINEIMKYGVMVTPALAVDGEVKSTGKVLSSDEIKKIIS